VEGCMDSTAVNYNPRANVNSRSWCIPPVLGCMLPDRSNARPDYDNPSAHGRQGLALQFTPEVTVHRQELCVIEHLGCTDPTALNFDVWATKPAFCWRVKGGCLDAGALNYGCGERGISRCVPLGQGEDKITTHVQAICNYELAPPPSPPSPLYPPGFVVNPEYTVEIKYATTDAVTPAVVSALVAKFAALTGQPASSITITFVPVVVATSSLRRSLQEVDTTTVYEVLVIVAVADAGELESVGAKVTAAFGSYDEAAQFLAEAGVAAGSITTLPGVRLVVNDNVIPTPSPPPMAATGLSGGAIAGIVIGTLAGVLLLAGFGWFVFKKSKDGKKVGPSY